MKSKILCACQMSVHAWGHTSVFLRKSKIRTPQVLKEALSTRFCTVISWGWSEHQEFGAKQFRKKEHSVEKHIEKLAQRKLVINHGEFIKRYVCLPFSRQAGHRLGLSWRSLDRRHSSRRYVGTNSSPLEEVSPGQPNVALPTGKPSPIQFWKD